MTIRGFRCWYVDDISSDGYTVTSGRTLADWEALPNDGLLCVMVYFGTDAPSGKPLRRVATGSDYYFLFTATDGNWTIGDSSENPDQIRARYPNAIIKRGMWTSDSLMEEVNRHSMASRNF